MKKIFTNLEVSRMGKLEFSELLNGVIDATHRHDEVAKHLEVVFQFLVDEKKALDVVSIYISDKDLTQEMMGLRAREEVVLQTIRGRYRNEARYDAEMHREAVTALRVFVNNFIPTLRREQFESRNNRVEKILNEVESNVVLKTAIATFSMQHQFDELKTIHEKIKSLDAQKTVKRAQQPGFITVGEMRRAMQRTLFHFLVTVEVAIKQYPAIDYTPLIDELNVIFSTFNAKQKSKETRRLKSNDLLMKVKPDNQTNSQQAV